MTQSSGDRSKPPPSRRFAPNSPVERKEAILNAAREEFVKRGMAATRTKVIADRAGVAEGLVFKYFRTKQDLFIAAVVASLDELVDKVRVASDVFMTASDRPIRTRSAVEFHLQMHEIMAQTAPLLVTLLSDSSMGRDFYITRLLPAIDGVQASIEQSVGGVGEFQVSASLLARVIMGTHFWLGLESSYQASTLDPTDLSKAITLLLARSIEFFEATDGQSDRSP